MHPRFEQVVNSLKQHGEDGPTSALREMFHEAGSSAELFIAVYQRSRNAFGFSLSPEDKATLESIERADEGCVWAFSIDPGFTPIEIPYVNAKNSLKSIPVDVPMLVYGTHISVAEDGLILLGSPDAWEEGGVVLIPPVEDARHLHETLHLLPAGKNHVPYMTPETSAALLDTVRGAFIPRFNPNSGSHPAVVSPPA